MLYSEFVKYIYILSWDVINRLIPFSAFMSVLDSISKKKLPTIGGRSLFRSLSSSFLSLRTFKGYFFSSFFFSEMMIQIWMVLIFLLACKWTEYNFVPHFDVA